MSNDGWADWGTDTANVPQASSDSDWDSWDSPTDTQTSNTGTDTGWDNWDSAANTATNTDIDSSWDNWDSADNINDNNNAANTATNTDSSWDDWGSADNINNNNAAADINSYWDNQAANNPVNTTTTQVSNLSSKKIAVIVLVAGIALALIILFISKLHITKQDANITGNNVAATNTVTNTSDGLKLIELNGISNTGNIQAIDGTVHNKLYYAVETGTGYSIVCLIQIKVTSGSNVEIWDYFCAQQAYNAVAIGDDLLVSYSVPSSGKCLIHNVQRK